MADAAPHPRRPSGHSTSIHALGEIAGIALEAQKDRDAARAALERVRAIVKGYYVLPYEAHFVVEEIRTELEES